MLLRRSTRLAGKVITLFPASLVDHHNNSFKNKSDLLSKLSAKAVSL